MHNRFINNLNRARTLFDRLVLNGGSNITGQWRPLMITDRRDIAQSIFFECATQWENYAKQSFILNIRDAYGISAQKAEYVVGSPDQGLSRIMGWGDPGILKGRAENFLGINSTIAKLNNIPSHGQTFYNRLTWSHKIRNRIAHSGSSQPYNNILPTLGVPANQRRGLGPARLLTDYPERQPNNNRWFHQLIMNYENVANYFHDNV